MFDFILLNERELVEDRYTSSLKTLIKEFGQYIVRTSIVGV